MSNNNNYGMIDPITNAIGMAYNIGTGIFNSVQNYRNNQWNQRFAREQFDYQKDLNQILMDREDNAVQRRAKDLQAAGISKNLAAGSSAQASTMSAGNSGAVANSNMQTQQLQKMDIMNSYAIYKRTKAEENLINQKAITEGSTRSYNDSMIALNNAMTAKTYQDKENAFVEYLRASHDYLLEMQEGIKSNDTMRISNGWEAGFRILGSTLEGNGDNALVKLFRLMDSLIPYDSKKIPSEKDINEALEKIEHMSIGEYLKSASKQFLKWFIKPNMMNF